MNLSDLRLSYMRAGLLESGIDTDPFRQFELWMGQALSLGLLEPNAMTLATVNAAGHPSARTVLLKGFDPRGFVFYTNYGSRKARDMAENPRVSLLFYWGELERQVRVSGVVARTTDAESDAYFESRPVGHQLGAWASQQSSVVASREAMEANLAEAARRFEPGPVPRPPHWGGYRVSPEAIEFWQGRPSRMHDRLEYQRINEVWRVRRLAP